VTARRWTAALFATLAVALVAPAATAGAGGSGSRSGSGSDTSGGTGSAGPAPVRFTRIAGFDEPETPAKYDKVGIIATGAKRAENVLVLVPGTSASAAYFQPMAQDIVAKEKGWQVWAVERRENLLEDHSVVDAAKAGEATPEDLFSYYLEFVTDPSITDHYEFTQDADVPFARNWGMEVAVEDIKRVVDRAARLGGKVVLGGHSLGGTITTAYATWDFDGKAGAADLDGLVFIDGGSRPDPISPEDAQASLDELAAGSPWLTFGGIPAPYAGLFNIVAATGVLLDPDGQGELRTWSALPDNLKPVGVNATNVAQYGYALDVKTSPPGLAAAQAHLGQFEPSGDPRGWDATGAITPIERYAHMFSGTGLESLDGTAWYHPQRLTYDAAAVASGNANAAQDILDVHATHGRDLPKRLRIYAFGASLGGERVLDGATVLAEQSGIPRDQLTLLALPDTYAHNDPAGASPDNEFLDALYPFLRQVA
jgi:pimeloyl-ACP methyl ester carboxylesterase